MTLTCTFIPTKSIYDLLCALWAEYRCAGNSRVYLKALREELGAIEFARFEQDMTQLMKRCSACRAVHLILAAAIRRSQSRERKLRTTYQPA